MFQTAKNQMAKKIDCSMAMAKHFDLSMQTTHNEYSLKWQRRVKRMTIPEVIKSSNSYFEDYITRCTYHSNAIEGNTLSYAETYAILFNDNSLKITAEPRELYEAINHKYALSYVLGNLHEELTEQLIKHIAIQINKNIMEIDGYRTTQVFIRGAEHIPIAPNMINQAMMYYVHNYANTEYESIFEKVAKNHIEFERIHPFADGNGRTGRLLINFELLRNNIPPVVIPKDERTQYFNLIANEDSNTLAKYFEKLSDEEAVRIKAFTDTTI